jgi:hypothetical protein
MVFKMFRDVETGFKMSGNVFNVFQSVVRFLNMSKHIEVLKGGLKCLRCFPKCLNMFKSVARCFTTSWDVSRLYSLVGVALG